MPNLILDGSPVDVVDEIRLLGVQIRADLSWCSNTQSMCRSSYARLWMLRRLKPLGANTEELLDVYDKQIRCMVEFASPVWTSGLTKAEVNQIERVQKAAFAIILEDGYISYERALQYLHRSTLSDRRQEINLTFAKKGLKSDKYKHWFVEYQPTGQQSKTRIGVKNNNLLVPVEARTKGFKKSPLAYLTKLINDEN